MIESDEENEMDSDSQRKVTKAPVKKKVAKAAESEEEEEQEYWRGGPMRKMISMS